MSTGEELLYIAGNLAYKTNYLTKNVWKEELLRNSFLSEETTHANKLFQINLKRIGDLEIFARNFKIGWTTFLKKRRKEEEQMEECKRAARHRLLYCRIRLIWNFFVRLDYFIVESGPMIESIPAYIGEISKRDSIG